MENSYYNLLLDDIRDPVHIKQAMHGDHWEDFPSHYTWVVVRSHKEFVETILRLGLPRRVSLDHDLSYEDQNKTDYSTFKELTGLDCAKWLADYCYTNNFDIPDFYVHSFNPVGRMDIANYLTRSREILAALRNPKKEA